MAPLLIIAQFFLVGLLTLTAQEREITKAEFWEQFKRSRETTKDIPFRERVTVETAAEPTGPWQPYSSWTNECILPDRSRLVYTSGRTGEFLFIGKTSYTRLEHGGWITSSEPVPHISPPASHFAYSSPVVFKLKATGSSEQIEVVTSAGSFDRIGTDAKSYTYSFDNRSVLVKSVAIVHNGNNWLRRTEVFEYDADIKIEAPLK